MGIVLLRTRTVYMGDMGDAQLEEVTAPGRAMARDFSAELDKICAPMKLQLGSILHAHQGHGTEGPDVEVLMVALDDVPMDVKQFDVFKGVRKCLPIKWLVLCVGPPGFSTAPYTIKDNKDKEKSKPLYCADEDGNTVFRAWHKVSNQKERGAVSEESTEHHSTLPAGAVVSTFMWDETFSSGVIVSGKGEGNSTKNPYMAYYDRVIPRGTVCVVSAKACNTEKASVGNGIAIKKIMPIVRSLVPETFMRGMPSSQENAQVLEHRLQDGEGFKAIRSLVAGNTVFSDMQVGNKYFWYLDAERESPIYQLYSEEDGNTSDVWLHEGMVRQALGVSAAYDSNDLGQTLDVLSACKALRVVVDSKVNRRQNAEDGRNGAMLYISSTHMAGFDMLQQALKLKPDTVNQSPHGTYLTWMDEATMFVASNATGERMVWCDASYFVPTDSSSDTDKVLVFVGTICAGVPAAGSVASEQDPDVIDPYRCFWIGQQPPHKHLVVDVFVVDVRKDAKGNMLAKTLGDSEQLPLIHEDPNAVQVERQWCRKVSTFYVSEKKTTHTGMKRTRRVL